MLVAGPKAAGSLDIGFRLQRQDLCPGQTGELGQIGHRDCNHGARCPRPNDGHKDQGDQDFREGPGKVDHRCHDPVEPAPEIGRRRTKGQPCHQRQADRDAGHGQ